MKAQSAGVMGALAVAGLVSAYVTWQRPAEQTDMEATVLNLSAAQIKALRYDDARRTVEVVPEKEVAWIHHAEKAPPPLPPKPAAAAADGGVVAAGATAADAGTQLAAAAQPPQAPPPAPAKVREYRGNDAALNVVEKFAPLMAVRALGALPEEKLAELGLKDSKRTLEVVTATGSHRFRLSSEALGATSPYVRDEATGKVYILKGTLVSDLEFASSRLVDRRLHAFRDDEFDRISVSADGKSRVLMKTGDKFAAADGTPDELATNWHARLWPQVGVDVLGRNEVPAAGEPQVQLRVDYKKGEKAVGFIELGKAGTDVFARTEHSAGWVRLHGGTSQILDERMKIVDPQG